MILTLFASEFHAYTTPDQIIDADWEVIAETLMIFHKRKVKEDVSMFNLWEFNQQGELGRKYHNKTRETWDDLEGTIRRCSENAVGLWGLVLDCDSKLTMEQAIQEVEGLEYVLYSSFRHGPEQDKFRIVIPFTRMMTKEEFELKKDDIKKCFPLIDPASFSKSQAIFFHSGPDKDIAIALRGRGYKLDPDHFENTIIPVAEKSQVVYTPPTALQQQSYQTMIKNSLMTCRSVSRSGSNEGITLAGICRSSGLTYLEFQQVCNAIGREGSSLKTADVQEQFWGVVGDGAKIKRGTREKFLKDHGGHLVTPSLSLLQQIKIKLQRRNGR